MLIDCANRLDIPLLILAPIADATPGIKQVSLDYAGYLQSLLTSRVTMVNDFLDNESAVHLLSGCSHLLCAMEELERTSGSLRLMTEAKRPIIATPSYGSREVDATLVQTFDMVDRGMLERRLPLPRFEDGIKAYQNMLSYQHV